MSSLRTLAPGALLLAALMAGCTTPPSEPASGAAGPLLGMVDATLRQAEAARAIQLQVAPNPVAIGGALNLGLRSQAAGYAYIYQIGSDGKALSLVFPNAHDGTNYVAAGTALTLPRSGWRLTAKGPAGLGYVVAVVSERQQDLRAIDQGVAQQRIALQGPFGAAMVSYREVAP